MFVWSRSALGGFRGATWVRQVIHLPYLLGVLLIALLAGCGQTPLTPVQQSVQVWARCDRSGAPVVETGQDQPGIYDHKTKTISLCGAINEILGFELGLAGPGLLRVSAGDFVSNRGGTLRNNVTFYRAHTVPIERWPGWHIKHVSPGRRSDRVFDVLVPASAPVGGLPARATADDPLMLWVDVRIPKGTEPGQYASVLNIFCDDKPVETVRMKLTVWPFMLPDAAGPALVVDVDHRAVFRYNARLAGSRREPERILRSDPARAMLEGTLASAMRLLQAHRLTPQLTWLYPVIKVEADQRIVVDWSDYDRVVAGYLSGTAYANRIGARAWRIPFDAAFPPPPTYGAINSPAYSSRLAEYFRSAAAHFDEMGWLSRSNVLIPTGTTPDHKACRAAEHFGYIARRADPRIRIMSRLFPQDMSGFGWYRFGHRDIREDVRGDTCEGIREYVDIWCPPAQFLDTGAIARLGGDIAWLAVDRPPFSGSVSICAPATDTRAVCWQGESSGAKGVYVGIANNWPGDASSSLPRQCIANDPNVLIYPGGPFGLTEPVPSARLKRLRRGAQDVAYLQMLQARGKGHIAAALMDSLVPCCGTDAYGVHFADGRPAVSVDDPALWELARRIMAQEVLSTLASHGATDSDSVLSAIRWSRFMQSTRRVRLGVSGVRIRQAQQRPGGELEIECIVSIRNRGRTPLTGVLRFDGLPVGWVGSPAARRVGPMAPNTEREIALVARAVALTLDDNGVRELPIVLETDDGTIHRFDARLCHLSPRRLEQPIVLDGDLSDWPTALINFAADFLLITGQPDRATRPGVGRATNDTLCFVGCDRKFLWFAFRCRTASGWRPGVLKTGPARLDDLIPVDQELVEILIDPSNAGTRSPADLFRLVIKLGGATWERGVSTTPPIGRVETWPVGIDYAIQVFDDYWTAEVKVPLSAFGPDAPRPGVWGINFTRFDHDRQEFSNWAGAVGNVFDPLSLGNMTMP